MVTKQTTPFGALLRHHRQTAGLSQEELAERAGLSVRAVSDLERGIRQHPYPHTVEQLAVALGLADVERTHFEAAGRRRPAAAAASRAGDELPTNLPLQLTSFIGREWELGEVQRLLGQTRLLTLTGTGGCGKTRLALQVATDRVDDFPGGVWLVELAPLADPDLVPQAVAGVLGVREQPGQPILAAILAALKRRRLLLLLDNCEHLIDASARLVDALLRGCPGLQVLVTSRQVLGIAGETAWRVPSLSLPDPHAAASVDHLTRSETVRLFVERATAVQTDSPSRRGTGQPWPRSAGDWTASRWPSSWRRRGCASCRSNRSRCGWMTVSAY